MMKKRKWSLLMVMLCCMVMYGCNEQKNSMTENGTVMEQTTSAKEEGITEVRTEYRMMFNGGKFQGWGTGIAWWGNRLGYSDTLTEQAIKLFFDEDTGLGMNVVRYNIPGGDDPSHTHITRTDTKLQGFTHYNEETGTYEFDKTADVNQRDVLLKIKEFCGDKLIAEAYACSPPYYMTESGCTSGSGKGMSTNLKQDYYDDYAVYLAEVLKLYRDEYGFVFDSISVVSEPSSDQWIELRTQHEGCRFEVSAESALSVKVMYTRFAKALEEYGFSGTAVISIDDYKQYIGRSYGIRDIATKLNVHTGYGLSLSYGDYVDYIKYNAATRNVWITESDSNLKIENCTGEMGAALFLANKIINDMGGLMPSAWVMKNAIDYHISAEGYQGNQDTGMPDTTQGYWGIAVADHDNEKIILTKKYYAYGQFSRYIRPGYTIYADNNDDVLVTYSPDEKKLVIVAVNNAETETELKISLEDFDYAGGTAKVIRTSGELEGGENWAELPDVEVDKDVFRVGLKGHSITTFIIDDVEVK